MTYNAKDRNISFFHYFSHLKRGGVLAKEDRAIEPYSFIVGPLGLFGAKYTSIVVTCTDDKSIRVRNGGTHFVMRHTLFLGLHLELVAACSLARLRIEFCPVIGLS